MTLGLSNGSVNSRPLYPTPFPKSGYCNAAFFHWPESNSTKLQWKMKVGTRYCECTTRTPYEVEIRPNLVWRQHTDQIKDSNVPVADNHTPVIQPLLFPPPVEYHGDQVAELPEQTEAIPRDTGFQPSNPDAKPTVSSPPSQIEQVPVRRYRNRERKPPARLDL